MLIPSCRYKERCKFIEETKNSWGVFLTKCSTRNAKLTVVVVFLLLCCCVVVVRNKSRQALTSNLPSKQFIFL